MNRLETERARLYGAAEPLVLGLSGPSPWNALSAVWEGVQADLELPAPAIVIDGVRGMQLWFALGQPASPDEVATFFDGVRDRYLAGVPRDRIVLNDATRAAPPREVAPGRWSAFIESDLASLFGDEPWLDLTPGIDGQADVLSRLGSIKAPDWATALQRLRAAPLATPAGEAPSATQAQALRQTDASTPAAMGSDAPTRFLLDVMNDPAIAMHLRIEAAKALLPFFHRAPGA